jgi:hypothetical protein
MYDSLLVIDLTHYFTAWELAWLGNVAERR